MYGARGANGVILVTTKKGKSGDTQISLDARWGVNSRLVKNYDVLQNANTYMETAYSALYNGYLYNSGYTAERAYQLANADLFPKLGYQVYTIPDGQYLIGRNGKLNPYATLGYSDGDYYYTPDNWSDEMFQSNLRQEYNLSVSGGSDKLSYYLSASYLNDEGIIENSGFERISTRMNVDYQAKKWLKLGVNLSYSNVTSRSPAIRIPMLLLLPVMRSLLVTLSHQSIRCMYGMQTAVSNIMPILAIMYMTMVMVQVQTSPVIL